ncbi:MAG: hypothetical protein KDB37_14525 [Ilumatobacter sp.]|nr:hypothetical protein [Ilumatobacter sp.]
MFRPIPALGVAFALLIAGCSSDDGASTSDAATASSAPSTTMTVPVDEPTTTAPPTTTTAPEQPEVVTIDVVAPDLGLDETVEGDAELVGDPFDDPFATCSAYRTVAGAYAVGVGDPDGALTWVSVVSAARIDGAGAVPADVRIELPDGREIDASGALVLDNDLAGGTFVATATDGATIEGSFECSGGARPPVTMAATDADAIEVVALVERDGHERVFTAALLGADAADCPVDEDGLVVRVDGDASTGAISVFELSGPSSAATLSMTIGATTYSFDDATLVLDDAARAGTFLADGDATVAGAFSCT